MGNQWTQLKDIPISFLCSTRQPLYITNGNNNDFILISVSNSDKLIKYEFTDKYTHIKCKNKSFSVYPSIITVNKQTNQILVMNSMNNKCIGVTINHQKNEYKWNMTTEQNDEKNDENNKLKHNTFESLSCNVSDDIYIVGGVKNNLLLKYNISFQ
eukprot:125688_1